MTRERKAALQARLKEARGGSGGLPSWQDVQDLLEYVEHVEQQRDKALIAIGAAWSALTMADLSLPQAPWGSLPPAAPR